MKNTKYTQVILINSMLIFTPVLLHAGETSNNKVGSAQVDQKIKAYPLDYCIVSDEKLGEMGDPITINYKGQEVKFCCKPCVKKFKKSPAKYLKALEKSINKK